MSALDNSPMICSYTAPDLMTAVVAGATTRIRVGSAGMLMLFHSPWYVAERFRLLAETSTLEKCGFAPETLSFGFGWLQQPGRNPRW